MNSYDVVGYDFNADTYCIICIIDELHARYPKVLDAVEGTWFDIEGFLRRCALTLDIDLHDERTYDSGDFPKVVFADQAEDEHCGRCHERLMED